MGDDQAGVKRGADPVAGEIAHDPVAESSGIRLDRTADDIHLTARGHGFDAPVQRLPGAVDELGDRVGCAPGDERLVAVAVEPVPERRDVDVHNVAIVENRVVGDAVTDDFVHRGADRLGVAAVAECRGVGAVGDEELVADGVEFIRGHTRSHGGADQLDRFGGDPPGLADELDLIGRVDVSARGRRRPRSPDVFRSRNARRNGPHRGDAPGDQMTGGILGHRIKLMTAENNHGIAQDAEHRYWYNMKTGAVEQGFVSPAPDRVGPFDTRVEAEHALEKLRENSAKWAEEDARED